MDRRQPATRQPTRPERDPEEAWRALRKGWAGTKWVLLIVACGVGFAGVAAMAILVLVTILQESV